MWPSAAQFWSLLRWNHLRLFGPDIGVRGDIKYVPLAEIAEPLHKRGAAAVDTVAADPAKWHMLADRALASISKASSGLVRKITPAGTPASARRSLSSAHSSGQEQTTVQEGMTLGGTVVGEHCNLAIVGPA